MSFDMDQCSFLWSIRILFKFSGIMGPPMRHVYSGRSDFTDNETAKGRQIHFAVFGRSVSRHHRRPVPQVIFTVKVDILRKIRAGNWFTVKCVSQQKGGKTGEPFQIDNVWENANSGNCLP
jgi:hypothetical protein